jgi:hypothetical protein
MTELLVNERGYFWWAETPIPDNAFAPAEHLAGGLWIDRQGTIRLTLDGVLPRNSGRLGAIFPVDFAERSIFGRLRDGRHLRLDDLDQDGATVKADAPSTESFRARTAMLARRRFRSSKPVIIAELELDLGEYTDWFGKPGIEYNEKRGRVSVRYRPPPHLKWVSDAARLTLERGVVRPAGSGSRSKLELKEFAFLRYKPQQNLHVDRAMETALRLEELIVLFTDSERGLPFPKGKSRSLGWVDLYFGRSPRREAPPHWAGMWIFYRQLEENLGRVVDTWLAEYERLGPGFHLYLGNRRGAQLYPEHCFASLVWGLEALHRGLVPIEPNDKLKAKIERIVQQIEKPKDQKWARQRLSGSAEPALADRLHELFSPLPISFAPGALQVFCQRCANRRNDLSHYGGRRPGESYEDFLTDVLRFSQALDLLYHARILQAIAVPDSLVGRVFSGAVHASRRARVLVAAGLPLHEAELVPGAT